MTTAFAEHILLNGTATTRDDAINEVAGILINSGAVSETYRDAMFARESSVSTYMGNYLAIPHGTNEAKDSIHSSAIAIIRYDSPLDWDGNEVYFVVGIAGKDDSHMEALAAIAMVFSDLDAVQNLRDAHSVEEIHAVLEANRAA